MTPQSFPLAWPSFRPRTPAFKRKPGAFKKNKSSLTIAEACDRLEQEVERLGGKNLTISTNVQPTLSGRPRSTRQSVNDPGVAIYFNLRSDPITLACDTFSDVAQNLAGLAGHIEATRRIERYGVQSAKETLKAFSALPPPEGEEWWHILNVSETASQVEIERAYRSKVKTAHPDTGGSHEEMSKLNKAREDGLTASAA